MAMLDVLRAGPMLTVQDQGRFGLLASGVSASGPMDPEYMFIANALVGNQANAAVLEFAGFGGEFRADRDLLVAVIADDCPVRCGDRRLPSGRSGLLRVGETLHVGAIGSGVWGYIAVAGGIAVPPVLGSRATHLRSGIGGLSGQRLAAGNRLPLAESMAVQCMELGSHPRRSTEQIRVVPGPQHDHFSVDAWQAFTGGTYRVTAKSDRMGMQLDGPPVFSARGHDIISDMTPMGAIQIPGTGLPVILLAERQPTGGYPKIATVASVDLPRLAQLPPGAALSFTTVSQAVAEQLLLDDCARLDAQLAQMRPVRSLVETLLGENLIDGVWSSTSL